LEGLINFIKDLIVKKSVFEVNLGVNWKKLKSKDLIDFLRSLIGRTKGLIVIILKFDGKLGI
jgi:hypothetical protein